METILNILNILGFISTVLVIISAVVATVLTIRGFLPVLVRLGKGLWKRKIAIFASHDAQASLSHLLSDSQLFSKNNVINIQSRADLGLAETSNLFLVYWPDWADHIAEILANKKDKTALIVYAPQDKGRIPNEVIATLENHRNVTITNFRGRLLSDIVVNMITTGYEKG